jgi:hypothetical protein
MFDVLKAIKEEMLVGTHLWISLQTNVIKDFGYNYQDNWDDLVGKLKSKLTNDNWYLPVLTKNLRNSSQVFDMVETLKAGGNMISVKDSLGVKILGMTLNATLPKNIPINYDESDKVLVDAIFFAIQQTKEELNTEIASFVILHDDAFKTETIYNDLKRKLGKNEIVLQYPKSKQERSNPSIDYIENFMQSGQHGCLVIRDRAYTGAEAENVILIKSGGRIVGNIRCNLMRCISNLSIIHVIKERVTISFEKVKLIDNFIKCKKQCNNVIHECLSCKEKTKHQNGEQNQIRMICIFCRLKCHKKGHSFNQVDIKDDLRSQYPVNCGCECNK